MHFDIKYVIVPYLYVPYYFKCPYIVVQDDDFVYFKVNDDKRYLYAFGKLTGTLVFRQFPTIYDNVPENKWTFLRSVVMDPNFNWTFWFIVCFTYKNVLLIKLMLNMVETLSTIFGVVKTLLRKKLGFIITFCTAKCLRIFLFSLANRISTN